MLYQNEKRRALNEAIRKRQRQTRNGKKTDVNIFANVVGIFIIVVLFIIIFTIFKLVLS
jgi:hypothetical protein